MKFGLAYPASKIGLRRLEDPQIPVLNRLLPMPVYLFLKKAIAGKTADTLSNSLRS
jgi:hypothetical protein